MKFLGLFAGYTVQDYKTSEEIKKLNTYSLIAPVAAYRLTQMDTIC
jgi:hypothetical protein